LIVNYPEAVVENGTISIVPVPGIGAEVRLYEGSAQCWRIRDAMIDVAWVDNEPVASKYVQRSNEKGEVLFEDIPAEGYYLVIFARQLTKYTEKYIELIGGDTLKLMKKFTPDGAYHNKLEPWDHEVLDY